MSYSPNLQPLGVLTVSAPGTTTLLSANCGPLGGGTVGTPFNPPLPGTPLRGITLQAASPGNVGNVYVLRRGSTYSAGSPTNPGDVIAIIAPDSTVAIPYVGIMENGILPENYCLDADTGGNTVYGYGIY